MREKNPNHNPQIKFNVDKLTEKVYEENKINKSFLGILALNKILLAKKEVLESIVNISKETHHFRDHKKIPNKKYSNVQNLEQTKDTIATAQKTIKYSYKSGCHSEFPQSKGMTVEIRDAQGGNKKGKKYGMLSTQKTAKDIRSLHCAGD